MTPNQPRDVVQHEHVFPSDADHEAGTRRFDARLLADGSAVVWDVDQDLVFPCRSYADARTLAAEMARAKARS